MSTITYYSDIMFYLVCYSFGVLDCLHMNVYTLTSWCEGTFIKYWQSKVYHFGRSCSVESSQGTCKKTNVVYFLPGNR